MESQQTVLKKQELEDQCSQLIDMLKNTESAAKDLTDHQMQELFESLIKIYAYKISTVENEWQEGLKPIMPIKKGFPLTEASIFADKLLQAAEIEIFELQIWRSMGASY